MKFSPQAFIELNDELVQAFLASGTYSDVVDLPCIEKSLR
ncbi:MAG: hypothetical protein ACI9LE_000697 [Paraglaciecola sp.]|jgi:hypothetical protein